MCGVVSSCATHSTSQEHAGNHPAGTGAPRSRKRTAPQVPARRLAATSSRGYVPWCCCYYGQFVIVPRRLPTTTTTTTTTFWRVKSKASFFFLPFHQQQQQQLATAQTPAQHYPFYKQILHIFLAHTGNSSVAHTQHTTHKSTFSLLHRMTCLS